MKRIILLLLIIMMLIPMAVSCAPKSNSLTSDLGVSRSNIVSPDGWAYYGSADGLFKIRPDGTDKTLILDATPLMYSIYEERIYYIPVEEDHSTDCSIYSCRNDGTDVDMVSETQFLLSSMKIMKIVDGWIFLGVEHAEMFTSYDLYRVRVDGTGMTKISQTDEPLLDCSIDGDWIYYLIQGWTYEEGVTLRFWRMRHDGTDKQLLMQEVPSAIDYNKTEIFYFDDVYGRKGRPCGDIYAVSLYSPEKRKVLECDAEIDFIKVVGDWVYYIEIGDNWGFYKVKTDGSDRTKIPVKYLPKSNRTAVIDNWLTYRSNDFKYLEMVRISDKYNTDDLLDQIFEDQLESAIRNLDMDDIYDQRLAERYEEYEIRKYE